MGDNLAAAAIVWFLGFCAICLFVGGILFVLGINVITWLIKHVSIIVNSYE